MRIVRLADIAPAPWANGAGETRELWSEPSPEGAGFDRRISVATLVVPAPFSPLAGIARTLLPIDDVAGVLVIDGAAMPLRRHVPIDFAGDAAVALVELARPGRVLNVMSRTRRWRHKVATGSMAAATGTAVLLAPAAQGAPGDLLMGELPELPFAAGITFARIAAEN